MVSEVGSSNTVGVASMDGWGSGGDDTVVGVAGVDGWGNSVMVTLPDDWCGLMNLDDWFALDGNWSVDWVWLVDTDLNWDLDDLLDWDWDVVWGSVWLLNWEGLVDGVDLSLGLDDGCVVAGGSLKGSWDGDVEVWDDWLQDGGVVSSNVGAGAVVKLLGDLSSWLVDRHSWGTLDSLGVLIGWKSDGWGGSNDWSSSDGWGSSDGMASISQSTMSQWSGSPLGSWGAGGSGKHGRQNDQGIHGVGVYLLL